MDFEIERNMHTDIIDIFIKHYNMINKSNKTLFDDINYEELESTNKQLEQLYKYMNKPI